MASSLRLQGWSKERRVVVLRRKVVVKPETLEEMDYWDENEVLSIAQMYRDRGDAENMFDELRNQ